MLEKKIQVNQIPIRCDFKKLKKVGKPKILMPMSIIMFTLFSHKPLDWT
jgi:hypothetical protein